MGPEDLHPRDAQAADDAEAQLHPKVLVGPATAPQREDQPHRQHLWRSKLVRLLSAHFKVLKWAGTFTGLGSSRLLDYLFQTFESAF